MQYFEQIEIVRFKNISYAKLTLDPHLNIFYGNNGQGKTNLLEAIHFHSIGKSNRTKHDKDLIQKDEQTAGIFSSFQTDGFSQTMEIQFQKNAKKKIRINQMPIKKLSELFGVIPSVFFSPDDLKMINDGPHERRKFIDIILCQCFQTYSYDLSEYYKILKQRNSLLKRCRQNKKWKDSIFIFDEQLIKRAEKIISRRMEFIQEINAYAAVEFAKISNFKEKLDIFYKENTKINDLYQKLAKYMEKDIIDGSTSVGPHKDDIAFFINDMEARIFASQGQKKSLVLSLKLAELEYIRQTKGMVPILLLDDLFSELDAKRQSYILSMIGRSQTFISGTENLAKKHEIFGNGMSFYVKNGEFFANGSDL